MIPIQLTLEGLYSYQERQKIDFQNLTKAGIFGIFGAVGSGKSSILEAITFALYGETERLNSRDKRSYNMMNLKSNRSYIEFDFLNFENKKFRATREFKRNFKNFEDVKSTNIVFYEWKNESWNPIENANPAKIIDLSYANFKRTIIIPQGQFKEFIELGATERTNMMKEIFDLHRFDLYENTKKINEETKTELADINGQLKGFEEVNSETIDTQKGILKEENEKLKAIKIEFDKIDKKYTQQKILKTDFETLNQKNKDFGILSEEKTEIDGLEKKTKEFETVFRIFNPLIIEKNRLEKEISTQKEEKDGKDGKSGKAKMAKETENNFNEITKKLKEILPKYEVLEETKNKEHDLNLILQMLQFSGEIITLKERTENGSLEIEKVKKIQKNFKDNIEEYTKKIKLLKPKKINSDLLISAGNWFSGHKTLQESVKTQTKKIENCKDEIFKINENELIPFAINLETYKEDFKTKIEGLEKLKKDFSAKKTALDVQQKLSHFANELHDGESCPLCGALEHPNILISENRSSEITKISDEIKSIEDQQIEFQNQSTKVDNIFVRRKIFEEKLKDEKDNLDAIKKEIQLHKSKFIWKEFDAEKETEFEQKKKDSIEMDEEIEALNEKITKEQENFDNKQKTLDKYNKTLKDLEIDEAEKLGKIKSNEENLKVLKWVDFKENDWIETQNIYENLKTANKKTEEDYDNLSKGKNELSPELARQKSVVAQLEKRISDLEKDILDNEKHLTKNLVENNFTELIAVQTILNQEIEVQKTREKIENFRILYLALKNGIEELELKLKGFTYDDEAFSAIEKQFKTQEKEKNEGNDSVVKKIAEIERLEKEFNKKKKLSENFEKIQKRSGNLLIMLNLFKGAGFVEYASSIYLRQLCDHANIRFHRMTKNQLSLQLNENNDFEILDYLNEGRSRSVKTLSGGQSFQVSLSLALALAESVQTKAKAENNFFFIDEGFGTQDSDSVNVVFDTLLSLQKENRIVGIISHVEELKEKMPISLNITKNEERGSLIELI